MPCESSSSETDDSFEGLSVAAKVTARVRDLKTEMRRARQRASAAKIRAAKQRQVEALRTEIALLNESLALLRDSNRALLARLCLVNGL